MVAMLEERPHEGVELLENPDGDWRPMTPRDVAHMTVCYGALAALGYALLTGYLLPVVDNPEQVSEGPLRPSTDGSYYALLEKSSS